MSDAGAIAIGYAITGLVLVGAGVLFLWMARRSEAGRLQRNQLAGVRTALTLASDEAWYPAQRAAAPRIRLAGWGAIGGGCVAALVGVAGLGAEASAGLFLFTVLASAAWLLSWTIAAGVTGERAARAAVDAQPR
ncbi:MAG TPA: SdpI family protein [Microbacteriaceae bacterium]|nr:SdpI family protein [Microbacteriaceae bacterium]HQZ47664.1 SdpI family protein [Microbacteriaceae bacterium]HRA08856.1 SdpI family protein [Microbacteriaceae bacterium]